MAEEGKDELRLDRLKMTQKRGFIPRRIWNLLIEALQTLVIVSSGRIEVTRRVWGVGTFLNVRPEDEGEHCPFELKFVREAGGQRLYIHPGTSLVVDEDAGFGTPVWPMFEGTTIDDELPGSWDVGQASPGVEYWVLLHSEKDDSELIIHDSTMELPDKQVLTVVAKFTFKVEDGELRIDKLEQLRCSDFDICCRIGKGSSGSGSSDGESSDSGFFSSVPSGESSQGGSSKDTAVVRGSWSSTGYVALAVSESPEVLFEDHIRFRLTGPVTRVRVDPRFLEVVERGSLKAIGQGDKAWPMGVAVCGESGILTVRSWWGMRSEWVTVRIVATRKGFAGWRFPERTRQQYEDNEAWLKRGGF